MRLAVLGGSSPYSAMLFDSLAQVQEHLPDLSIVVHGRSHENASLLARYGAHRLGCQTKVTSDMGKAIDGADVVLNQIRFGGLETRLLGERFCSRFSVHADETLGPAALITAIRIHNDLLHFQQLLDEYADDAWLVNLTNPLSYVNSVLDTGTRKCLSLCELPKYTAMEISHYLQLPFTEITWHYTGLNHRGFIHGLSHNGEDLIPELAEKLKRNQEKIGGIAAHTILQLHAVPLKYFRLFTDRPPAMLGRAKELIALRREIYAQLKSNPTASPPALLKRYLAWYSLSVVPCLEAIRAEAPKVLVANVKQADQVTRELLVEVCADGLSVLEDTEPPSPVKAWMNKFERHEKAFAIAAENPSLKNINDALAVDPTVPEYLVADISIALFKSLETANTAVSAVE